MKVSLKVQDQPPNQQPHNHNHRQPPLLLRAKLPITVFGLPFLSVAAATDPSDLSLSLRTNFLSGPSLKLTYTPATTSATAATWSPLTVTLRSGVGLFGSPKNSPLVISAHFSLSPQNPNPTPTFSLQIKPRFGDFSLLKTARSSPPNPRKPNGEVLGFVPIERPVPWKDLNLDSNYKDTLLSGIFVTAKTTLPVTKTVAVNCRWGVNFPADIRKQMPFLTVSKIEMERVCDVKEVEVKKSEGSVGDLELLKGLCVSVRREVEGLYEENREMKRRLEEMRFGKYGHGGGGKKVVAVSENCGEFEQWKSKRSGGGEEPGRREAKKSVNLASDVESELQRAIKAAST
ncbi:hypothetical protein CEY00_Acc33712 [Actinidia chinensis var. chinensis]|uniref:Uncharacterized protein n=1 Tax=Actinidia chinensis var. chinensis TaxID=1590841 RepID=A0A2R6PII2_ACTCC|nr:hypothetical protein CEY00_Acc33712 [Actinidia chinensis var. chinensis]